MRKEENYTGIVHAPSFLAATHEDLLVRQTRVTRPDVHYKRTMFM